MFKIEHGDWFISEKESFGSVKILRSFSNESDGKLYVTYYNPALQPKKGKKGIPGRKGKSPEWIQKPIEQVEGPFLPTFMFQRRKIQSQEEMRKDYLRIYKNIEKIILDSPNYELQIKELVSKLEGPNEQKEIIEKVIKILIAEGLIFKYKNLDSGEFLEFSSIRAEIENNRKYYGSLAQELRVKSEKISLLISHGQTVGNYRELILRSFLKSHIPSKFEVATGFIEGISQQIDILIYDAHNHSATFKDGDLVVVKKEAVRAIIEVKTNLISAKLGEALEFFYDISRAGIFKPDLPVFRGVFAFETPYKSSISLSKYVRNFYSKPYFNKKMQEEQVRDVQYLYHQISCINVVNTICVFSRYEKSESGNIIPSLWSISDDNDYDIQTAVFLSKLFDFLDVDFRAKKSVLQSFSVLFNSSTFKVKKEIDLTSKDWVPRAASKNEHDFTQELIVKRLEKLDRWFAGEVSSVEYLRDLYEKE